jgi:hypothetical protein
MKSCRLIMQLPVFLVSYPTGFCSSLVLHSAALKSTSHYFALMEKPSAAEVEQPPDITSDNNPARAESVQIVRDRYDKEVS